MKRIDFLYTSGLGIFGSMISKMNVFNSSYKNSNNLPETSRAYISESGIFGKDVNFFIGILNVDNWQIHENQLNVLRQSLNYRSRLKYNSNDRYKVAFARKVIEYFVNNQDITLVIKKVPFPNTGNINNPSFASLSYQKISYYKELLDDLLSSNKIPSKVITKYQSINGPSGIFSSNFQSLTSKDFEAEVTYNSNLLQMSAFLCGSIASDIRKIAKTSKKVDVTNHLKNLLNIDSFNTGINGSKLIIKN